MIQAASTIPAAVTTIMADTAAHLIAVAKTVAALIKAQPNPNRAVSAVFSEVREVNDIMKQAIILRFIRGRLVG
jgi:hypothetical protein